MVREGHPLFFVRHAETALYYGADVEAWAINCDDRDDPGWRAGLEEYDVYERNGLRARTQAQVRERLAWLGMAQASADTGRSVEEPPPGLFRRD